MGILHRRLISYNQSSIFIIKCYAGLCGFIFIFFLQIDNLCGQEWKSLNAGLYGGETFGVAAKGSLVLTITNRGVFRSNDNGDTWQASNDGISAIAMRTLTPSSLLFSGNRILLGSNDGLYYSDDGGLLWKRHHTTLRSVRCIFAPLNSSAVQGIIFVEWSETSHGSATTFSRSTDNGETFTPVKSADSETIIPSGITGLEMPSEGVILAVTRSLGVLRSTDIGKSWRSVQDSGLEQETSFQTLGKSGSRLFAVARLLHKIFVSDDEGQHWERIASPPGPILILCVISFEGKVYLGTTTHASGVFVSDPKNIQWVSAKFSLPNGLRSSFMYSLAVSKSRLFAASDIGILCSEDRGENWRLVNYGIEAQGIGSLTQNGHSVFAATFGTQVFRLTPVSNKWQNTSLPEMPCGGSLQLAASKTSLLGSAGCGLIYSADGGAKWSYKNNGLPSSGFESVINSVAVVGTTLFAGSGARIIYRSTDNAESWVPLSLSGVQGFLAVTTLAATPSSLFAGTWEGDGDKGQGVWRSDDTGNTWRQLFGLPVSRVLTLSASGDTIFAGLSKKGLYRSTDNGESWSHVSDGLSAAASPHSILIDGTMVYAALDPISIFDDNPLLYRSSDGGISWEVFEKGLPASIIPTSLTKLGSIVYLGTTNAGVYTLSSVVPTGVYQINSQESPTFSLVPNPASHSVTLECQFPETSRVTITITDMIGCIMSVQTVVALQTKPIHADFDVSGWANGIYVVSLQHNGAKTFKPFVVQH